MEKIDYKKEYKFLYKASSKKPAIVDIPTWSYIALKGQGAPDSESETFNKMMAYAEEVGYKRLSKDHDEIYLSDIRKVSEDKLKTVLAFEVK